MKIRVQSGHFIDGTIIRQKWYIETELNGKWRQTQVADGRSWFDTKQDATAAAMKMLEHELKPNSSGEGRENRAGSKS